MTNVQLQVADHFHDFIFDWDHKIYSLIGAYGSGKSFNIPIKIHLKMMQEKRRAMVVREVYETHLDSTYQTLMDVAELLDPEEKYIKFKKSPLRVVYANGSEIIFRGLDKVEKMKSIQGITIVWIEEASEIKYAGYKELLLRLRNKDSLHILLSTNPVSEDNWVYTHFFKDEVNDRTVLEPERFYNKRIVTLGDTYYHHSTVDDNPFVNDSYVAELDKMEEYDPDLYRVARLGHFGILGDSVFTNVERVPHDVGMELVSKISRPIYKYGLDFGFETSYNALTENVIDHQNKILYITKEYYTRGITDDILAADITEFKKNVITADSAHPSTIAYLRQSGYKIKKTKKGAGSVIEGIRKLKRFYKIVILDSCPNAWRDFSTLSYKEDKNGQKLEKEYTFDAHCVDSVKYAIEDYEVATLRGQNARRN